MLSELNNWFQKEKEKLLEDFFTFLRFPSISTEKKHEKDLLACAKWLFQYVQSIGFEAEEIATPNYPLIYAEKIVDPQKPTLLIYGHYDVQPIDPIEKWKYDPFTPTVEKDIIYARGASDNKGQLFYTLCGLQAFQEVQGEFPVNIKCIFEGEEEASSVGIEKVLPTLEKKLQADCLLVPDVDIPSLDLPAITIGARGISAMEISLQGSEYDLHSGAFGGIAYNPLRALSLMLSSCWNSNGTIAIPHFYDAVKNHSQEEEESFLMTSAMEKESKKPIFAEWHEESLSALERCWLRPTLEINGISGGYTGDGFKTVIPSHAYAKISCRLVPNQDPKEIYQLVKNFLTEITPQKMKLEISYLGGGNAVYTSPSNPFAVACRAAYTEVLQQPCGNILTGGSVPIIDKLKKCSKDNFLMMGMALPGDMIHAPNEHFAISRLEKGVYLIASFIAKL